MAIKTIKLNNFKTFKDVEIDLNYLNILAGSNSVGKSSIIQALLLHKQNDRELLFTNTAPTGKGLVPRFQVNGSFVNLGDESDLLCASSDDDFYKITVTTNESFSELKYCKETGWELLFPEEVGNDDPKNVYDLLLNLDKLKHISSNRIAPAITYELSKAHVEEGSLGSNGEYTAHYLSLNKHMDLPIPQLVHENSVTTYLLENVSNWLAEISDNIYVNAKVINEAQKAAITYEYSHGITKTDGIIPLNVGFGITHVLPIITQLLIAEKGDILILENPEAQLHPKAQVKIANLIALAAQNGVQIVLETHSDHILNAIRVATKNSLIDADKTNVYFFERPENQLEVVKHDIKIFPDGSLDKFPKGMFDEWDNQLDNLLW